MWLKYYDTERQRFPDIAKRRISATRIQNTVERFFKDFGVTPCRVDFTPTGSSFFVWEEKGKRRYCFGGNRYVLVVLHELAHHLDIRAREGKLLLTRGVKQRKVILAPKWHGPQHAAYVTRLVEWYKGAEHEAI